MRKANKNVLIFRTYVALKQLIHRVPTLLLNEDETTVRVQGSPMASDPPMR